MSTVELLPPTQEKRPHRCAPEYEYEDDSILPVWVDGSLRRCDQCGQHWEGIGRYWVKVSRRRACRMLKRRADT